MSGTCIIEGEFHLPGRLKIYDGETGEEIDDVITLDVHYGSSSRPAASMKRPVPGRPSFHYRDTREVVSRAEATPDGGFCLPSHKYEKPCGFDFSELDIVKPNAWPVGEVFDPKAEGEIVCPTCNNEREVVNFNQRVPCPDCRP